MSTQLASPEILNIICTYGYLAVALGIGIESTGIPFPGEIILVTGAIYAGAGHLSILWVIIASSIGAIIGDNLGYTIGRYGGYRLLKRFGKYIHIYPQHLEYAEKYFKKHGGKTVFFGRFVSILRTWAAFLAGTHKMKWKTFLAYNAAGGIVWSITFGILGYFLGKNLSLLSTILHGIGIFGIFAIVSIILAVFIAWRKILRNIEN